MKKQMIAAVLALATGVALAGCSDKNDDSEATPSDKGSAIELDLDDLRELKEWEENVPDCSEVWIAGEKLPEDYDGCMDEDGTVAIATSVPCADGLLDMAFYDDRYWTRPADGTIVDAGEGGTAGNSAYGDDYAACSG